MYCLASVATAALFMNVSAGCPGNARCPDNSKGQTRQRSKPRQTRQCRKLDQTTQEKQADNIPELGRREGRPDNQTRQLKNKISPCNAESQTKQRTRLDCTIEHTRQNNTGNHTR